jgi:hypothetical protein
MDGLQVAYIMGAVFALMVGVPFLLRIVRGR